MPTIGTITTSTKDDVTGVAAHSITHNHNGNVLVVYVSLWDADMTCTEVRAGGSAMTQRGLADPGATLFSKTYSFTLLRGTQGNVTVEVDLGGTANPDASVVGVVSLIEADPTPRATQTATGTNNAPTVTVTSAVGDLVISGLAARHDTAGLTITKDASQTEHYNLKTANATAGSNVWGVASSETASGVSTVSSYSMSLAKSWALVGMSFPAATTVGKSDADTLTLTDDATSLRQIATEAETLTLTESESLLTQPAAVAKSEAETLTLTDDAVLDRIVSKSESDVLTLTEATELLRSMTEADTLTLTDAGASQAAIPHTEADTMTLSDGYSLVPVAPQEDLIDLGALTVASASQELVLVVRMWSGVLEVE